MLFFAARPSSPIRSTSRHDRHMEQVIGHSALQAKHIMCKRAAHLMHLMTELCRARSPKAALRHKIATYHVPQRHPTSNWCFMHGSDSNMSRRAICICSKTRATPALEHKAASPANQYVAGERNIADSFPQPSARFRSAFMLENASVCFRICEFRTGKPSFASTNS